jgi:Holliday junction resolvase RusA-like endonuclease
VKWSATFALTPVAKGRPRLGKFGAFTPAKTRKAEGELRYFISQNNPTLFTGAICVAIDFVLVRPASVTAKKRPWPVTRPDIDNYVKGVMDAANGILWVDDAQIVTLLSRKLYGDRPSVKLSVWKKDRAKA